MTTQNKRVLALILFVLISSVCMAQKDVPPAPGKSAGTPPPGFPINGGVLVGVCVGVFYGAKKMLENK